MGKYGPNRARTAFPPDHLDFHTNERHGLQPNLTPRNLRQIEQASQLDHLLRPLSTAGCIMTRKFPERIHPHLANRNLLKEQIEACHRRKIKCLYISRSMGSLHSGAASGMAGGYSRRPVSLPARAGILPQPLPNSPYRELVKEITAEVWRLCRTGCSLT